MNQPGVAPAPAPVPAAPPAPPAPPPVMLPAPPTDPNLPLPPAPVYPPTQQNVLNAIDYNNEVNVSHDSGTVGACCTEQDRYNAALYQHNVITQAAAAAAPQAVAPPWFQAAILQLRADIRADIRAEIVPTLNRVLNKGRGDGVTVPYEIVPFPNGQDPTVPPHNLPLLTSRNAVYGLNAAQLDDYLIGYQVGLVLPGANAHATNQQRKAALLRKIRA